MAEEGNSSFGNAFDPDLADIAVVRALLSRAGLIADVIDDILDYAEYWLHSSTKTSLPATVTTRALDGYFDGDTYDGYEGNCFLVRSYPLGLTASARLGNNHNNNNTHVNANASPDQYYSTTGENRRQPLQKACEKSYFDSLVPYPITNLDRPARRVVFRIRSHDQGWTTHSTQGAFHDARTWFDVGIERLDSAYVCEHCGDGATGISLCRARSVQPPVEPSPGGGGGGGDGEGNRYLHHFPAQFSKWEIQRNEAAKRTWSDYVVTWSYNDDMDPDSPEAEELFQRGRSKETLNGEFVRNLRVGDIITVWGRAAQFGWCNYVDSVEVHVYWAM